MNCLQCNIKSLKEILVTSIEDWCNTETISLGMMKGMFDNRQIN